MVFLNQGESAAQAANEVANWARGQLEKTERITLASGQAITYDPGAVRLRAPVPRPPKILCLALNYIAHAEERSRPLPQKPYVFVKPGFGPVAGPSDPVYRPPASQGLVFEGELGVVIGQRCRFVPKEKAYQVVAGYTVVNDMSARDLGKTNVPTLFDWFRVKAFDSSLPMGPCLVTKDEIRDPHNLEIKVRVNGNVVQEANTGEMIFKIPETIEFLSDFITLEPGDIIATGTPGGSNDPLKTGDQVDVEISGIGVIRNVVAELKR
jgi:2-keto-4-pentenoate hydratase/2-oxohepta-3-ene-1,7-dioic acid hydratase in catechol pathway